MVVYLCSALCAVSDYLPVLPILAHFVCLTLHSGRKFKGRSGTRMKTKRYLHFVRRGLRNIRFCVSSVRFLFGIVGGSTVFSHTNSK